LFFALKFARDERLVVDNWEKVLNFGSPKKQDDRQKILFQSLTLYLVKLFDMPNTKVEALNEQLPEVEHSWVDAIPEIFGERWKKQGLRLGKKLGRIEGREEGRAEGRIIGKEEGKAEGRSEGRAEGRAEALEEARQAVIAVNKGTVTKAFQKFPDLTDTELADLAGVTLEFVQQVRQELGQ
jgi:flagellar biosynthesis/type III secretory pathway protein FliH